MLAHLARPKKKEMNNGENREDKGRDEKKGKYVVLVMTQKLAYVILTGARGACYASFNTCGVRGELYIQGKEQHKYICENNCVHGRS